MRLLFTILLLCLAMPATALTVSNDMGGPIYARLDTIAALRAADTPVRITGTCASSCTLYLGLPKTCVSPSATVGFHGPSGSKGLRAVPLAEYNALVETMASHYPTPLATWFKQDAAYKMDDVSWLTGQQLISMGVRSC